MHVICVSVSYKNNLKFPFRTFMEKAKGLFEENMQQRDPTIAFTSTACETETPSRDEILIAVTNVAQGDRRFARKLALSASEIAYKANNQNPIQVGCAVFGRNGHETWESQQYAPSPRDFEAARNAA